MGSKSITGYKVALFEFQEVKWDQNRVLWNKMVTFEFQGAK